MRKIGIYPGTFDPITKGHIDVVKRSLKIVDKLIIAVSNDHSKEYLFSSEERSLIVEKSLFNDLKLSKKKIKILTFNSLTTSLCSRYKATVIIRGLRALSDYEYEFKMALMNRTLNDEIVTLFMMQHERYTHVSSSLIKEVASLGGDMSKYVPPHVESTLREKFGK